ncbi:hypothetical protein GCM10028773_26480 [Spirosoma koreense]
MIQIKFNPLYKYVALSPTTVQIWTGYRPETDEKNNTETLKRAFQASGVDQGGWPLICHAKGKHI